MFLTPDELRIFNKIEAYGGCVVLDESPIVTLMLMKGVILKTSFGYHITPPPKEYELYLFMRETQLTRLTHIADGIGKNKGQVYRMLEQLQRDRLVTKIRRHYYVSE